MSINIIKSKSECLACEDTFNELWDDFCISCFCQNEIYTCKKTRELDDYVSIFDSISGKQTDIDKLIENSPSEALLLEKKSLKQLERHLSETIQRLSIQYDPTFESQCPKCKGIVERDLTKLNKPHTLECFCGNKQEGKSKGECKKKIKFCSNCGSDTHTEPGYNVDCETHKKHQIMYNENSAYLKLIGYYKKNKELEETIKFYKKNAFKVCPYTDYDAMVKYENSKYYSGTERQKISNKCTRRTFYKYQCKCKYPVKKITGCHIVKCGEHASDKKELTDGESTAGCKRESSWNCWIPFEPKIDHDLGKITMMDIIGTLRRFNSEEVAEKYVCENCSRETTRTSVMCTCQDCELRYQKICSQCLTRRKSKDEITITMNEMKYKFQKVPDTKDEYTGRMDVFDDLVVICRKSGMAISRRNQIIRDFIQMISTNMNAMGTQYSICRMNDKHVFFFVGMRESVYGGKSKIKFKQIIQFTNKYFFNKTDKNFHQIMKNKINSLIYKRTKIIEITKRIEHIEQDKSITLKKIDTSGKPFFVLKYNHNGSEIVISHKSNNIYEFPKDFIEDVLGEYSASDEDDEDDDEEDEEDEEEEKIPKKIFGTKLGLKDFIDLMKRKKSRSIGFPAQKELIRERQLDKNLNERKVIMERKKKKKKLTFNEKYSYKMKIKLPENIKADKIKECIKNGHMFVLN